MKRFPTTFALLIGLAAHCPGQEPSRLPGPKNQIERDRFILDGMKEDTIVIFMGDNGEALPPFRSPIFVSQRAKDI